MATAAAGTGGQKKKKKKKKQLPTALLVYYCYYYLCLTEAAAVRIPQEIQRGFSATPGQLPPSSSFQFQPILSDPSGNFSLGFLLRQDQRLLLDLAVIHLPSSLPVWRAAPARPVPWSGATSLSFNGSLLLSHPDSGILWSTDDGGGGGGGDRVVLLNTSNLQIQTTVLLWQSFDYPSDTLVQGQNFTSSSALFSADENRYYSMRLGSNYVALFMNLGGGVMYWKETALEARAQIVKGGGPIYAMVNPLGFLGLYQNETSPVHVEPFDSFNRGIPGFRRLTLESDGNLRGYYWNGTAWAHDYLAISDVCNLPASCGAYGLCRRGSGECGCLDNRTEGSGCFPADSGDLCGGGGEGFWVLRQKGVDLAYKELMGFERLRSLAECEGSCERNCSCWGAFYNNDTGYCYKMDFPVETLVAEGGEKRMGYFKVRNGGGGGKGKKGPFGGGLPLLVVGVLILAGIATFGSYRVWSRRGDGSSFTSDAGLSPGPYQEFRNSSTFRSIELSSFRK